MGTFSTRVRIANGDNSMTADLLVDTGATYTVLPEDVCERLGIIPVRREMFTYADGRTALLSIGDAVVSVNGRRVPSPVVFGTEGQYLLGATTLQALGLIADTSEHTLIPAPRLLI